MSLGARWARFGAVSALGLGVQLAVLLALARVGGLHYALATVLAVSCAIAHNFLWHERWTWADRPSSSVQGSAGRLARFTALTVVTSAVGTVALTAAFVEWARLPLLAANVLAVASVGVLNFLGAHRLVFLATLLAALLVPPPARAAELQPGTVAAWDAYVRAAEARMARELDTVSFVRSRAATRDGKVAVWRLAEPGYGPEDITVPGGLINHWCGALLVPRVGLDRVLEELRSPLDERARPADVLEARVLSRDGDTSRIYLKLSRTAIVTATYSTEHEVRLRRLGPSRAVTRSVATRIAELEHAGSPGEREAPVGRDRGFLWRLNAYWRYEQAPGGVIVELESLTLSRDVPLLVRDIARPIIDGVARDAVTRALDSMRARLQPLARP